MIKELIQFTRTLPGEVKKMNILPKEGLHVLIRINKEEKGSVLDTENVTYEIYNSSQAGSKDNISSFLENCAIRTEHAWCINTNKCFDIPARAIQSCSPYVVGFKREYLKEGTKYKNNESKNKSQIYDRFGDYFTKALELLEEDEDEKEKLKVFEQLFTSSSFETILFSIREDFDKKLNDLYTQVDQYKLQLSEEKDKSKKEELKNEIKNIEKEQKKYSKLSDSDYIIFYLDVELDDYIKAHNVYLKDRLFNTSNYNIPLEGSDSIYGTSDFFNGFDSKKLFLLHRTATFDITGRISDKEANELYQFQNILSRKFLPNPLPIFIYDEELNDDMVEVVRKNFDNSSKIRYQEIIKELWKSHHRDIHDYYLLFYQNTKDGIVFNDFDFVTQFEYELRNDEELPYWEIFNLFKIKEKKDEKGESHLKYYPKIENVFDLEKKLFGVVLANKFRKLDSYFGDIESKNFENLDYTLIAFRKYRKSIYDYIYKSKKQLISPEVLKEIMLAGLKDNIKHKEEYGIKEKLNIWFSLNHYFDKKNINFNNHYMPDKLDQLIQKTVEIATSKEERIPISDEYEFAFISGNLIHYILTKSESADTSHNLLESFSQKTNIELYKKEICRYFLKYKHAINRSEKKFDRLMREVMAFDKKVNIQDLLIYVLAGYFTEPFYRLIKNQEQEQN